MILLHIERVASRVTKGGHDIPEAKIRERWSNSVHNLMGLIQQGVTLNIFDNSIPADDDGPSPVCLFHLQGRKFVREPIKHMPEWAKPLASRAMKRVLG